jgi:hypothetical protein
MKAKPNYLSKESFQEALMENIGRDIMEVRLAFRAQRERHMVLLVLVVIAVCVGILTFVPSTMVTFLIGGYIIYLILFGRRRKVRRVELTEDLKRLLLRETANLSGGESFVLTHRFMPPFVFKQSELFDFEPEKYFGEELVEVKGEGKVFFSKVSGEEKPDIFDKTERSELDFEGWLFRIFPKDGLFPNSDHLSEKYRFRFDGEQAWLALKTKGRLYIISPMDFRPDFDGLYELYEAIMDARKLAAGREA